MTSPARPYRIDVVYDKTGWPCPDSYQDRHTYAYATRERRDAAAERFRGEAWVGKLETRDVVSLAGSVGRRAAG